MDAIGIDIRQDGIAIAHVKAGPFRAELKGWRVVTGAEDVASYIREKGIKKPRLSVCLPTGSYMAGALKVPAPDQDSIGRILKFELDRLIPFGHEDAYYGYEVLKREENLFTILFTATPKKTADELVSGISGIDSPALTTRQAGLYNALSHLNDLPAGRKAAFICLEDNSFTIDVFDKGLPCYSRSCGYGSNDALVRTIRRELRLASTRRSQVYEAVIVDNRAVHDGPVETFEGLGMPVSFFKHRGAEMPSAFLPAFGAALAALKKGRINLNLLPSAPDRSLREVIRRPALSAALGASFVLISALYPVTDWLALKRLDHAIAALEAKKAELEGLKNESDEIKERIKFLSGLKGDGNPGALDALKEVTELSPKGTWLTAFEYNNGSLGVEGFSDSASSVFVKMGQSALLKDLELSGPVTKDPGGKERFRLKTRLNGYTLSKADYTR